MPEVMGEFTCGNCHETVPLKKDNRGKFYYHCGCGQHFMRGPRGADVVLEKASIFGAEPKKREPEPEPARNVNVTEKPQEGRSLRKGPPAPPPPPVTEKPKKPEREPEPEPEPAKSTFF